MTACNVRFHPGEVDVDVPIGTDVLTAAEKAGVQLYSSCGGDGVCGHCRVVLRSGTVDASPSSLLTARDVERGYVLACQSILQGDADVDVPPESRSDADAILTHGAVHARLATLSQRSEQPDEADPIDVGALSSESAFSTKLLLDLPPPTIDDNVADLTRVRREIGRAAKIRTVTVGSQVVRGLAKALRAADWRVTTALARDGSAAEVIAIEPGDTTARNYGIAIDVGTTTLVARLIDLNEGTALGTQAIGNPQRTHGEDVISRLIFAEKGEGLARLQELVVDAANGLIGDLLADRSMTPDDVTTIVCAGNTTMAHLLLGVDPYYLRRDPYVPAATSMPVVPASETGLTAHPRARVACVSGVSSYVGGDITAGVLASGLDEAAEPSMLIDLGTNGEIVLGNRDWLVCCSASAGPAFEGGGVRSGTRAMRGAIQSVTIDRDTGDVFCATIGDARAIGVCGSGYIEAIAELFEAGIVDRQGRFRQDVSTDRLRRGADPEFVLVPEKDSGTGNDVVVTQSDIENLIRSKGSIYSAAKLLVEKMGIGFGDLAAFYIGGGFGNYLHVENSIRIGLLPDLPLERFEFIGNSSLTGAEMALRSYDAHRHTQEIAARMTNIELCADPAYMGEYTGSLFLPHTNIDLFPTVKRQLEG